MTVSVCVCVCVRVCGGENEVRISLGQVMGDRRNINHLPSGVEFPEPRFVARPRFYPKMRFEKL